MEKEKQVVTQISEQKVHFQNGDKEVSNMENQKNKKIIIKRGEKMKNKKNNLYFAIAGILAPILWFSLVIILGLLEPGYSHMTKTMSVLGGVGGIRGFIFNLGLSLVGILIILFSIALHKNINKGKGSKVGSVLLVLGGIGMIISGIFHCNLNCTNALLETDFTGIMHMLFAFIAGMCLAISPFFIFARLRKDSKWKNYSKYTLITGIMANVPGIIFWITLATVRFPSIEGIIQRAGIVFVFIWIGVMSLKMLKLNMKKKINDTFI